MLVAQTLKGDLQRGYVTVQDTRLRVISMPLRRPDGKFDGVQVVQEAAGIELAQKAQMVSMLSALPIVLLISFGLSVVLSRLVLVPVSKLTRTAETLAQNTGSPERIETTGEDEMGRLSIAFNQMTDQMQSASAQLAESLERQKRFASDAAHELRTPLTSIALAAENGLHDGATEEERLRSLQIIERSSASLRRLTDILLSLARIDAGRASMELAPLSISSIVPDAIANAGLEGDARIRLEIDENSPTVLANADAMRQILTNLLSNAAAATPEDGFILIAQSGTCLRIQDSGAGIAPEHLSKLFDRFFRVDTSRTRASGGFGLGLAITKALVDAQGANISVSSSVGKGTTFSIEFQNSEQNS
jgi:two-component system OmpR family sensor kinase